MARPREPIDLIAAKGRKHLLLQVEKYKYVCNRCGVFSMFKFCPVVFMEPYPFAGYFSIQSKHIVRIWY